MRQWTDEDYRFGYQGLFAERDKETGLNHFKSRNYDGITGRWLAVDPQGQFSSAYVGMGNLPHLGVDPDGELAWFVPIIIGAALGGISQGFASEQNGGKFIDGFWKGALIGGAAAIGVTAGLAGASFTGIASGTVSAGFGATVAGGAAGGLVSGGLGTAFYGGNLGQNLLNGAFGGAIGGMVPSFGGTGILPGAGLGALSGGLGGGLSAAATGGDFWEGAKQGAISGGISGGIYGGIAASESKYQRNIVFGNATKAGKQAFVNDLVRDLDLAASVNSAILTDEFNGTSTNASTRPIIGGGEQTLEYAMANNPESTMSNIYLKYRGRSLKALASTFRHELVHANDYFYGNVGNFYNSQTRHATWRTKVWAEVRGYRANIQFGYRNSTYTGQLNKWLNAWQTRYGTPYPY